MFHKGGAETILDWGASNIVSRRSSSMRVVVFTLVLLSFPLAIFGAELPRVDTNPIRLTQTIKDGTLRVSMKNVSHRPILAYVVGVEDGGQSNTHHDFFTGRDAFGPGKTIELVFAIPSTAGAPKVFVDYVRLADRSTWGNPITDDGKDVEASFLR
jgi:hypothetical protein